MCSFTVLINIVKVALLATFNLSGNLSLKSVYIQVIGIFQIQAGTTTRNVCGIIFSGVYIGLNIWFLALLGPICVSMCGSCETREVFNL